MALNQTGRMGKLTTPLAQDKLCLVEMTASEGLSELFEFEIHAASEDRDIDLDTLIGMPCHVELDCGPQGRRSYHGVMTEGDWVRNQYELAHYRLLLRPWLWLLGKTTDCRIFHDKTVVDIIKETFKLHGFSDYRLALTHAYPVLHYTVQYRETDLNFVSRLMEQHGIYYHFEHTASEHTLVLDDGYSSHAPDPNVRKVIFHPDRDASHKMRRPTFFGWSLKRSLRSGKVDLNDYNHVKPNSAMRAGKRAIERYGYADMEVYDHPGPYPDQDKGQVYAKVRLEAEQAPDRRRVAEGTAVSLYPGTPFRFARHPRKGETGQYMPVHIDGRFGPQIYWSGRREDERAYDGSVELQRMDIPFRAPQMTEKPLINSMQTALVVGAPGEEIDCDDHGRILVHFYWDRHADRSCRLRVSQVWGGKLWGGQIIPRVGMEVMVAFLEGDPDRPIVVGCVPDPANNNVPYKLPDDKTRMVIKSNTHKGYGFNELSFEDERNQQDIYVHAQKDMNVHILHHRSDLIEGNHDFQCNNDKIETIGKGLVYNIGQSFRINVGMFGSAANVTKLFNDGSNFKMGAYKFNDERTIDSISGTFKISAQGAISLMGGNTILFSSKESIYSSTRNDYGTYAKRDTEISTGRDINITAKKTIHIIANEEIVLTDGKSSIKMDGKGGLTIKADDIKIIAKNELTLNSKKIKLN